MNEGLWKVDPATKNEEEFLADINKFRKVVFDVGQDLIATDDKMMEGDRFTELVPESQGTSADTLAYLLEEGVEVNVTGCESSGIVSGRFTSIDEYNQHQPNSNYRLRGSKS